MTKDDPFLGTVITPPPLSVYRVIWDARGIRQINERLAEGWELIAVEFCEEIVNRSPVTRIPTTTAYQPYAIVGKRDLLTKSDRDALAIVSEQVADIPIGADAPSVEPPAEVPSGREPRGVKAQRTTTGNRDGFQGTGALAQG